MFASELGANERRLIDLHELTAQLVLGDGGLQATLEAVLDASIRLLAADMGNLQVYDRERSTLVIVAHRNFPTEYIEHFKSLPLHHEGTTCGAAVLRRQRVIVDDAANDPLFGTNQAVMAGAGVVTVQSTPLLSQGGEVMGVISTHFRERRFFSDQELHALDAYARSAADAIERDGAQQRLREAQAIKDDFLGMVSHELKHPLTGVLGFARLLQRRPEAIGDESMREAIDCLLGEAERLEATLNNMLVLARLDSESVDVEPVSLPTVLRGVVREFERQGIPVNLHIEEPLIVSGRPEWMRQIVWNLLSNATKYGEPDRGIDVRLERDGTEAAVRVLDRGEGIDPELLDRAFTPFVRGNGAHSDAPGFGIGLTVCRRLAQVQGGQVDLRSRPDGGTEARVTMPLAA